MQLSLPPRGTLRINAYGAGLPDDPKAPGKGVWVGVCTWGGGPQVYRETLHRALHLLRAVRGCSRLCTRPERLSCAALLPPSLASLKPCDLSDPLCAEHTLFHRSHITILELHSLPHFAETLPKVLGPPRSPEKHRGLGFAARKSAHQSWTWSTRGSRRACLTIQDPGSCEGGRKSP